MTKKRYFCFVFSFIAFLFWGNAVRAATFADYVYAKAKAGDISSLSYYMSRGYNINENNREGMTALCKAVEEKNFTAYKRLRELGASKQAYCMSEVDQRVVQQYENGLRRYAPAIKTSSAATNRKAAAFVNKDDNTLLYAGAGLLAAGGVVALALSGSGGGSSKHHPAKEDDDKHDCSGGREWNGTECVCPSGQTWNGEVCETIECSGGREWNGTECVCPSGQTWNGEVCETIECSGGRKWNGTECVCPSGQTWNGEVCETITCPVGQRLSDGECKDIICPKNTHLVGNICVADEGIDEEQNNDDDLYGVSSEAESIFNLYSSPSYPDDESAILLKNKGDGDVYGIYGYSGEVFNSYIIGNTNGGEYVNPKPEGTGTIRITDEGKGAVYGMYSHISDITQYKEAINAAAFNDGTAHGNIEITHTGGGDTYGLAGDVRAYNAYANYGGKANGNIDITADGNIYGIYGYVAATNAVNHFYGQKANGNISLTSTGYGDVYGIMINKSDIPGAGAGGGNYASWFAFNAYTDGGDSEGTIDIINHGDGNVYGMYGGQQLYNAMSFGGTDSEGNPNSHAKGLIKIKNYGNGNVYGMYMPEADTSGIITNENKNGSESRIEIDNEGHGVVTGMRGGRGNTIINSGDIIITRGNATGSDVVSVGIYGEGNSKINNSGNIEIYAHSSTVGYGIYAENGASVVNSGNIHVQGLLGAGIYLENGATLENTGTVSFEGASGEDIVENGEAKNIYGDRNTASVVNLNDLGGGEVVLGQNGKFIAESIAGDMAVSEKVAQGSFENYYVVKDALQAENTDNLNLSSKSAMFTAKKEKNDNTGYDVVLQRRAFDSLLKEKSAADFWEKNYEEGNGAAIFDDLKTAQTNSDLLKKETNYRGEDVIPSFRRENSLLYSHLSRQFNENLFDKPEEKIVGGYKYIDISRDKDGMLVGNDGQVSAAYGMVKGKNNRGMTYGLGATISQLKSDYDDGSSRKSNIFGLWVPVGYDFKNGTKWYSKLYAGYEDGSYDRQTALGKFSSDITSYQYGVSNELRHNIHLGNGFNFTPAAELNLLGVYQDGFDEGSKLGALHTDKENMLSLEGGLGAYLSKEFNFNNQHQLGIQIGGIYYVEFLDPDDGIDTSISGMSGRYKMRHKFDDDRAVVSARLDYRYKNFTLYGMIEQELKNYKGISVDVGLQYNL